MPDPNGEADTIAPRAPVMASGLESGTNSLFPREAEIRLAQDLMFFAYRDFTKAADEVLEGLGLGRAHHRALHFIGGNPAITVSDLLSILGITKQSLARVLSVLVKQGLVSQAPGRVDRRQRLLALTAPGQKLERQLFERQRDRLAGAYRDAGGPSVEGFRRVMRAIVNPSARAYLDTGGRDIGAPGWASTAARPEPDAKGKKCPTTR